MAAIETIMFAGGAGFAVVVIATFLVIIGVHQEERRNTLAFGEPPTILAMLARRVVGAYIHLEPEGRAESEDLEEEPPWYERPVSRRAG